MRKDFWISLEPLETSKFDALGRGPKALKIGLCARGEKVRFGVVGNHKIRPSSRPWAGGQNLMPKPRWCGLFPPVSGMGPRGEQPLEHIEVLREGGRPEGGGVPQVVERAVVVDEVGAGGGQPGQREIVLRIEFLPAVESRTHRQVQPKKGPAVAARPRSTAEPMPPEHL